MTYLKISHDQLGECNQRPKQCVICVEAHKSKNYKYRVTKCRVKRGKIYIYIVPKSLNCRGNHQATAFKCPKRQKV